MKAKNLLPGDLIDLEGDKYADPDNDPYFQDQYVEVWGVERETHSCVRIDTDGESFGFPPDHDIYLFERKESK